MVRKKPPLSELLREAIRTCGMSLNQLEKASGVGRSQLSRFMRRERGLTLQAADEIAAVLRLTLTEETD